MPICQLLQNFYHHFFHFCNHQEFTAYSAAAACHEQVTERQSVQIKWPIRSHASAVLQFHVIQFHELQLNVMQFCPSFSRSEFSVNALFCHVMYGIQGY